MNTRRMKCLTTEKGGPAGGAPSGLLPALRAAAGPSDGCGATCSKGHPPRNAMP